ncbi:hypothetical protein ACFROC_07535 [Nocardia tengchongensis]|uniref:hypothetical protein n=1 Tax=Nocardia tengchongensis TaxID=2055889 RepID=UPI0036881D55
MSAERLAVLDGILAHLGGLSPTMSTLPVLAGVIDAALTVPAPQGDLRVIRNQSDAYAAARTRAAEVVNMLGRAVQAAPQVWRGQSAQAANQQFSMLFHQLHVVGSGFELGAATLSEWADNLAKAQAKDADARDHLRAARAQLSKVPSFAGVIGAATATYLVQVVERVRSGCQGMRDAAQLEDDASRSAGTKLRLSALDARARQFAYTGVSELDAVILAYQSPGLLSPAVIGHVSERLAALGQQDRKTFDALVAGAASTTEAQYLWKALGAGYSIEQLTEFDGVIHPHGGDEAWLRQHLSPNVRSYVGVATPDLNNRQSPSYEPPQDPGGGLTSFYSQGDGPICVAASDTVGRLELDPVLMLGVTTGTGPAGVAGASVGDDRVNAVHARVQQLYEHNYQTGKAVDGRVGDGLGVRGKNALAESLLSPATGKTYDMSALDTTDARRAALPQIQAAAAAGNPVPFVVEGTQTVVDMPGGSHHRQEITNEVVSHQMLIVDARSDRLEVYNPWGFTQWVSTEDFVNNRLGEVTSDDPRGGMPDVVSVSIPSDEAAHHGATGR